MTVIGSAAGDAGLCYADTLPVMFCTATSTFALHDTANGPCTAGKSQLRLLLYPF